MNKYLVLFICFIFSLLFVTYEDNTNIRESFKNEEVVTVFYEMDNNYNLIDNPDTSDININVYFVIFFYSLLCVITSYNDFKKMNKYLFLKN